MHHLHIYIAVKITLLHGVKEYFTYADEGDDPQIYTHTYINKYIYPQYIYICGMKVQF